MGKSDRRDKLGMSASIQDKKLSSSTIKEAKNKESCFDKYAGSIDLFSTKHSRRIDRGGERRYGSFIGIFLSLCLTLLIILYTAQKVEILIKKKDDRIVLTELPYFYDDNETITGSEKFNIAFGLE